jgi:BirA family biotin operon repressor/biotin-[acetyl-CoA-carboxylase] ligase
MALEGNPDGSADRSGHGHRDARHVTVSAVERPALDQDRLRGIAGWQVVVAAETESTNAVLLAAADAPDRAVLAAEYQSAGRGRLDRAWVSPPRAGLTFSVLLRPAAAPATWGWLPLLAGVALAEAVQDVTGVDAALKWPNDLIAGPDEHKLAGILAQSNGAAVVIGIGLNVSTTRAELLFETATSLALLGAADVDRTAVLVAVLERIDRWHATSTADPAALATAYRARCKTLGRQVRVTLAGGGAVEGVAADVDESGRLQVRTGAGVETVAAGDVAHLRPA